VLGKTLGVPLFQEQAMSLAIRCAGFSGGEADRLRRAMASWKSKTGVIKSFGEKIVGGMVSRGYERAFAERCFRQLRGFSEYGFPESHAASFAHLVYVSCYLKRFYPAAFCCALLNSQPMGFYAPAQLVKDAERHGVRVLAVDVNASGWECALEGAGAEGGAPGVWGHADSEDPSDWGRGGPAVRLGMRMVKGLAEADGRAIERARHDRGGYWRLEDVARRAGVGAGAVRALARADAFGSMGLTRREALWHARALRDERLPLFDRDGAGGGEHGAGAQSGSGSNSSGPYEAVDLPEAGPAEEVLRDYERVGLSLRGHPMDAARPELTGALEARALADAGACPHGRWVEVAGVVLIRQRPGTASGIVFMTIEDETGIANLIVRPEVFERYRAAARHAAVVRAWGWVERGGEVVHVRVSGMADISAATLSPATRSRDFH